MPIIHKITKKSPKLPKNINVANVTRPILKIVVFKLMFGMSTKDLNHINVLNVTRPMLYFLVLNSMFSMSMMNLNRNINLFPFL